MNPTTTTEIEAHQDLVNDRTTYREICVPMYNATIKGDLGAVKDILEKYSNRLLGCRITNKQETPLHIAAMARSTKLVEHFVSTMEMADLELQNENGNTAFCLAVIAGNTEIVDTMLKRRPEQLTVRGSENMMPLYLAALYGNHMMVKHLFSKPDNNMEIDDWNKVFLKCVEVDLLDVALQILDAQPSQQTQILNDQQQIQIPDDLQQIQIPDDQQQIQIPDDQQQIQLPDDQQQIQIPDDQQQIQIPDDQQQIQILDDQQQIQIPDDQQQNADFLQDEYVFKVLLSLARKPSAFDQPNIIWKTIGTIFEVFHLKVGPCLKKNEATQLLRDIWEKLVVGREMDIDVLLKGPCIFDNNGIETQPSPIPFVAAKMGNVKFLVELIRVYPDLIWMTDDNNQTIFHVAVSHRRESIYSLLYEIGSMKDQLTPLTDQQGNNILHLAGMSPVNNPYENSLTAPFQMQHELLWFKEVKAMIPPFCREAENAEGRIPYELFTENHKDLVSESKKWMKETTNQCMVAAALIATIGFAVITSIPGGYDQDSGFPHFLHDGHLVAFIIFDAISFILSSVSILMFLSIVVSRYTETDFSGSLPQKLRIGLATLFLSILTMMVAFGVSFFVVYHHTFMLIPVLIFAVSAIPVLLYTKLQFPLLADVFHSTFGSRHLFKPKRHMLYYQSRRF